MKIINKLKRLNDKLFNLNWDNIFLAILIIIATIYIFGTTIKAIIERL